MPDLVPWFLLLHVLGAIVAFGPVFAFPIIGAMGGAEPMHVNFATRVSHAISDKRVTPVALSMPVTGVGLIWSASIDVFSPGARWLLLGIVLYVILLTFALAVQRPAVERIIALTSGPPAGAPAGPPPSGPPPGLMENVAKVQRGGMITAVLLLAIIFLMVVKPNIGF